MRVRQNASEEGQVDAQPRSLWRNMGIPGAFVGLLLCTAVLGPEIASTELMVPNLRDRNLPPLSSGAAGNFYLLGSDALGRNQLVLIITGSRLTISIALLGAALAAVIGTPLGLLAGYFGGLSDQLVMRLVDVVASLPTLLIALFVLFVLGPSVPNLILVLVLVRWVVFARLARGVAMGVRELPFIEAARAIGNAHLRILRMHIWPSVAPSLFALFFLEVAVFMLAEASLSFLGFGVRPPDVSWGLMIAQGRSYIREASWLVTVPGLLIFVTVWSLNIVGSKLRAIAVEDEE